MSRYGHYKPSSYTSRRMARSLEEDQDVLSMYYNVHHPASWSSIENLAHLPPIDGAAGRAKQNLSRELPTGASCRIDETPQLPSVEGRCRKAQKSKDFVPLIKGQGLPLHHKIPKPAHRVSAVPAAPPSSTTWTKCNTLDDGCVTTPVKCLFSRKPVVLPSIYGLMGEYFALCCFKMYFL